MSDEYRSNLKLYLGIYCFIFCCFGALTGTLGPVIPFLSQERHLPQTEYSFLFVARTFGSVLGFFIFKYKQSRGIHSDQHQTIVSWGVCSAAAFLILIWWPSRIGQIISMLVLGGSHYSILTTTNMCLIFIAKEKSGSWMPLLHGMFGVGALTSPLLLSLLELKTYYIIFALYLVMVFLCYKVETPFKVFTESEPKDDRLNPQTQNIEWATVNMEILLAGGAFLIAGIEMTVNAWIPTYAVLIAGDSKEQAAIFGSLFWVMSTLFRFLAAALVSYSCSIKLKSLLISLFTCSVICVFLHLMGLFDSVTYFGALSFGASCSAVFPLLFAASTQFNIKFKPQQYSRMLLAPAISAGFSTGVVGHLMRNDIGLLFLSLAVLCAAILIITWLFLNSLANFRKEKDRFIAKELEMDLIVKQ